MVKINEKELKQIFNEIKIGNNSAFESLYSKYYNLVYGIAFCILKNKQDAEDITQTVFAKIYNIEKSKLPIDREASWIYSVTKNEAITLLRKKNDNLDLDSIYEVEESNNEIDEIVSRDSYNRLIKKLNDKEKEIISLKVLANLSFKEIAHILGEPVSTIKWRYYKSINYLKLLLSNLAMFIITFIIGRKTVFKEHKLANQESMNDEFVTEDQVENDSLVDNKFEENKQESAEQNTIIGEETNKNEIVVETKPTNNINNVEIGIFSISAILLVITIIFSIFCVKHQFKRKK